MLESSLSKKVNHLINKTVEEEEKMEEDLDFFLDNNAIKKKKNDEEEKKTEDKDLNRTLPQGLSLETFFPTFHIME